jgi:hypothetical protein
MRKYARNISTPMAPKRTAADPQMQKWFLARAGVHPVPADQDCLVWRARAGEIRGIHNVNRAPEVGLAK